MRLFAIGDTPEKRDETMKYIEDLRPHPAVSAFLTGFSDPWNETTWSTRGFLSGPVAMKHCFWTDLPDLKFY